MLTKRLRDLERQADAIEQAAEYKRSHVVSNEEADEDARQSSAIDVNTLMNMNDMYYVGNLVDVDGNGWVTKAEAQAILDDMEN